MTPEGLALFAAVAGAHALGVMSPGPDFAMVTRQSLRHGRGAGVWTAAGIGSGIVFHVAYGLFGLRWLTEHRPGSLQVIALVGALFLIGMGAQALRRRPPPAPDPVVPDTTPGNSYVIGLMTNLFNPKATLFFVALFTTLVTGPVSGPMLWALAVWLPLSTFGWFASVALLLSHRRLRARLQRHAHQLDRGMGLILVLLGSAVLIETLMPGGR
ncbi:LysE family translocator [Methylibium sp.]|uniref:LysE family translocator n=1 Tax=Methylibium sp. TaxID=2067992 RepID=UPI003342E208